MNWQTVVISSIGVILSALISYVVALLTSKRQKELEFRYDFRKYILEKRKDAYNEVEKIMHLVMGALRDLGIDTEESHLRAPESAFRLYMEQYKLLSNKKYWLSENMMEAFSELTAYLTESLKKFDKENLTKSDKELKELHEDATIREKRIFSLFSKIVITFNRDITRLDDIQGFLAERKKL